MYYIRFMRVDIHGTLDTHQIYSYLQQVEGTNA